MFTDEWERELELKYRTESIQSWAASRRLASQLDRPSFTAHVLHWIGEDLIEIGTKLARHFDSPIEQAPQKHAYHH